MTATASLVLPHQLFSNHGFAPGSVCYLVEETLFFRQYAFHKQKLAFHRASMRYYATLLASAGVQVHYVDAHQPLADVRQLLPHLANEGITRLSFIDPTDDWLGGRIRTAAAAASITLTERPTQLFLNSKEELADYFHPKRKRFFQTEFYISQRKQRRLLVDSQLHPEGGKWSFDIENRRKFPAGQTPPSVAFPASDDYYKEAVAYVSAKFPDNPGQLTNQPLYPWTHKDSAEWLDQFIQKRLTGFGHYEDAIVANERILHHAVLTPMLNAGLLTPAQVVKSVLLHAQAHDVALNDLEGFVRQITGWREFIRGMYEAKGREQRTSNFWRFTRKLPPSFYDGTTGIAPVDITIKKVLATGYCHHIERLMVLGNFMLLCEFDPDEVYRWFMELFIDACDWVMVPNVYGMSQFADGGLLATKPYISGSNYLMKMSDYPKGDWQQTWDALFWRFMHVYRDFFTSNPRLGILVKTFDKMPAEKRTRLLESADDFLARW